MTTYHILTQEDWHKVLYLTAGHHEGSHAIPLHDNYVLVATNFRDAGLASRWETEATCLCLPHPVLEGTTTMSDQHASHLSLRADLFPEAKDQKEAHDLAKKCTVLDIVRRVRKIHGAMGLTHF